MVDNGSDDGTREYLADQPDVSVWSATAGYKQSRFGMDWITHLQRRYCHGHWTLVVDPDDDARSFVKTHGLVAADVMTRGVIGVDPDTDLSVVANLLESKRIKRVFILEEGKVTGVVTRSDIVKTLMRQPEVAARNRAM